MATILIIDDDADMRRLISVFLTKVGFDVFEAVDGKEGVGKAVMDPPDLIILDINMPVMDGTKVMKVLRQSPVTAGVPVLALSGISQSDMRDEMHQLGCHSYVTKPVDMERLAKKVQEILGSKA